MHFVNCHEHSYLQVCWLCLTEKKEIFISICHCNGRRLGNFIVKMTSVCLHQRGGGSLLVCIFMDATVRAVHQNDPWRRGGDVGDSPAVD